MEEDHVAIQTRLRSANNDPIRTSMLVFVGGTHTNTLLIRSTAWLAERRNKSES